MMNKKDYYEILGIKKGASEKEIKEAHRKLILKWHPERYHTDSKKKDEATKKTQEINEAYSTLSDSKKRRAYDQYGGDGNFNQGFGSDEFDQDSDFFSDIFDKFFGGNSNKRTSQKKTSHQGNKYDGEVGEDILISLVLNFKELVFGVKKEVTFDLKKACQSCHQSGASAIATCKRCLGQGTINIIQKGIFGSFRSQTICPECEGQGKVIKEKCRICSGKRFIVEKKTIELNIPRGIRPEEKLRYQGIGNDGLHSNQKGDIYVVIKVKENSYFQYKNGDIHVNLPISFLDAILGNSVEVITLERIEKVTIEPGTQNNHCLTIHNRGCYLGINKSTRGNFYIWLQVKLPKKVTGLVEEVLQKLKKETSWNPNHDFIKKNQNIIEK